MKRGRREGEGNGGTPCKTMMTKTPCLKHRVYTISLSHVTDKRLKVRTLDALGLVGWFSPRDPGELTNKPFPTGASSNVGGQEPGQTR